MSYSVQLAAGHAPEDKRLWYLTSRAYWRRPCSPLDLLRIVWGVWGQRTERKELNCTTARTMERELDRGSLRFGGTSSRCLSLLLQRLAGTHGACVGEANSPTSRRAAEPTTCSRFSSRNGRRFPCETSCGVRALAKRYLLPLVILTAHIPRWHVSHRLGEIEP